jgi:autotransporter-associated beta strand protein
VRSAAYGVDAGSLSDGSITFSAPGALKTTGSITGQGSLGSLLSLSTLDLSGQNANLAISGGATVFADGILRTLAGANPWGVQLQGTPYFTNYMSTISGGTIESGTQELMIRTDTQTSSNDAAANQVLAINSVIDGSAGLTKTGAGYLILGGSSSNTYTGTTTLLAGTTILQKTGGATAINGNILIGDGTNTAITLQLGNGYLNPTTNGFTNEIGSGSVITFNTITTAPFLRLSGASQTLAGIETLGVAPIIENTETGLTPASPAYYASTLTINNTTDDNLGAASVIRDGLNTVTQQFASLALVKGGGGKLTVGVLNNTGGITVNAGGLLLGAGTTAPAAGISGGTGLLSVAGGALVDLNSFTARFDGLSGSGIIENTSSATIPTLSAPNLIIGDLDSTNMATGAALTTGQTTWSGTIQDGPGAVGIFVQKVGHGTETINTAQSFTKGLSVFGGTLALDFSTMATPTNIISPIFGTTGTTSALATTAVGSASITTLPSTVGLAIGQGVSGNGIPAGAFITAITSATAITISSNATAAATTTALTFTAAPMTLDGALTVLGNASTLTSQTLSGLNVALGASAVSVNPNGGTTTVALGAIGRPLNTYQFPNINGAGLPSTNAATAYATNFGLVDFNSNTGTGTGSITTTTVNNATGIIGAYATFAGNDWATSAASGTNPIMAYSGYALSSGTLTATSNVGVVAGTFTPALAAYNSLHFADNTGSATVSLTAASTLTLTGSGILVSSAVANNPTAIQPASGTATLTAGNAPGASDLVIYQNNVTQPLTISTVIANNPTVPTTAAVPLAISVVQTGFSQAVVQTLYPGMGISASGGTALIPAGDYIKSVDSSGAATQITLNAAVTGTAGTPTSITFANANGLTKAGPGTLILGTTANTFSGQVAVLDGTLSIGTLAAAGTAQPLGMGSFATVLGGAGGKTGVLQYTGATVSTLKTFYLGDGGFGEFNINNAAAQTLTINSLVTGGGGLNISSTVTGANSSTVILNLATNNYLGVTTVKSGILKLGAAAGTTVGPLGAMGDVSNGTVVQSGATLDINGFASLGQEVVTISGTGATGTGALINSGATQASALKNIILAADATIGTTTAGQIGIANGFIQGNGHALTYAAGVGSFMFFTNSVLDNVASVTAGANGSLVIDHMSFGSTPLTTTGTAQVQFRAGTLGTLNLGVNGILTTSTALDDNYVTGPLTLAATSSAATWLVIADTTLSITGNITGPSNASIAEAITKGAGAGMLVFGGNANVFTGGLVLQAGVTKIMPLGGSGLVNPLSATNNLTINTLTQPFYPANTNELVLDNSKTTGTLSQSFTNLTSGTAGGASTITLNNATGNALSLLFTGTFTRTADSELFLGSNSTPSNVSTIAGLTYQAPSATGNRIDIANYGTGVNPGVFFNTPAGTEYVVRDTTSTAFLRPVNYGVDTGTNGVTTSVATVANTGTTAWTKVSTGGSVTAQASGTIGSLTLGGTGSLAIDTGNTLIVDTKGLLKNGGGTGTISGNDTTSTLQLGSSGTGEFLLRADSAADTLNISSLLKLPTTAGNTVEKYGQGRVILSGANTAANLTATFNIREGVLRLANSTALGATTSTVTIFTPSALEIDGTAGNLTIANNINGSNSLGFDGQSTGGIRNIAGNNIWSGTVALGGAMVFAADSGSLTFTNTVSGAQDLYTGGNGNVSYTGSLSAGAAKTLYHIGNGVETIKSTTAIGFNGNIVNRGGTLLLDQSVTNTNMLPTTDTLITSGGNVQWNGKSGAATAQTLTAWDHRGGITRLSGTQNGATSLTINLGNYTVATRDLGSANFDTTGTTFTINLANAQNGILEPWLTVNNDWAVSSGAAAGTISALGTYTEFTGANAAATTDFTISTGSTVNVGAVVQTINSLKFDNTAGAQSLNIAAGGQVDADAMLFVGGGNTTITGNGTGILGRTTTANYLLNNGAGTVTINNTALANNTTLGTVFAGIGSGGFALGSGTVINSTTGNVYFEGGTAAAARQVTSAASISLTTGALNIGLGGNDNVVFTQNTGGSINIVGGTFNVGYANTANSGGASIGTYIQNDGSFTTTGAIQMGGNNTANNAVGTATFNMHGGTFTNNGSFTVFGALGTFTGTQDGGTILLSRTGANTDIALFVGEDASNGGSANWTQSGGIFTVNGASIIGGRNGGTGTINISGTATANFYQGLVLGLQDFAQGTVNQSGGTVSIGTGSNISDGNYLKGNNTIDLVLAYNQTAANGDPAITKGTYNLTGGTLQANGITTGQGNGYLGGANAAPSTFTEPAGAFTTTSGGTANFNWQGATLQPFDNEMTIGTGVNVTLTGIGAILSTNDKDGIARQVTVDTSIGSTGAFGPTVIGNGVVLLNMVNTYSGDTTINSGTVKLGVANALASGLAAGNVVLPSGASAAGTLDLNGFNLTVNGINGDSTNAVVGQVLNNGGGAVTLTVGTNDTTSTYNGLITNNTVGTGSVALTKTGVGNFTLGGADTYAGPTQINGGTLTVKGTLTSIANSVAVGALATLAGSGTVNGPTTVASGGTITSLSTGTQSFTLSGGLTFNGNGTINVSNVAGGAAAAILTTTALNVTAAHNSVIINVGAGTPYTSTDYVLVKYNGGSTLSALENAIALGTVGGLSARQSDMIDFTTIPNEILLDITGTSPTWTGYDTTASALSSVWKTDPAVTDWTTAPGQPTGTAPTSFQAGDAVTFDDTVLHAAPGSTSGNTTVDISNGDVQPSSVLFNNSTATYTLTGSNGIADVTSGTTSLVKSGTGQLIIDNTNSFTGGVNLNGGTITLGSSTALGVGPLGASTNTVNFGASSNAVLQLNSQNITIGGLISPDNTAAFENGGATNSALTVNISVTSTPAPQTQVFAGVLRNGAGVGSLALDLTGTGTLVLTGANTYTGGTTIGSGALQIGNNTTTGSIIGNVSDSGSLVFDRSNSVTYPGTVTGTGAVTVALGTVVLTGAFSNTGLTTVNSGATLQVGDGVTNGTIGNVTDNSTNPLSTVGVVFDVNGTPLPYAGTISGGGDVTVSSGTVVLTGAFSNTGTTTINSGAVLAVGNGTIAGTLGGNITDNGTLTFDINNLNTLTYASIISQSTGTGVVNVNSGTVILTNGNSYTGNTNIAAGATLQIGVGGTTGSIDPTGTVADGGTLIINRSGTVTFGNNITDNSLFPSAHGTVTINGPGTVILSGTNSYSGPTNILRATTKLGSPTGISTNTALTIGSGGQSATLDLFNQSAQIGTLVAAGTQANQTITNNGTSSNSTLTINTAAPFGNSNYGGKITDGATKKTGVTVIGGGSLTYSGPATGNTYTLPTAIQNGTFLIGATNAGTSASAIVLGLNATVGTLDLNGFNGSVGGLATDPSDSNPAFDLVGNSGTTANTLTLTIPAATTDIFAGVIQDKLGANTTQTTALTVANNATGVQVLTGTNTYSGTTTITTGTLQIGNAGITGTLGTGAVSLAGTLLFDVNNTYVLGSGNAITGAGAIAISGGGTLDTSTTAGLINTTGALNFGSASGSAVLGNMNVNANATVGSLVVQTNSASADTVTFAGGKTLTVTGAATIGSATTGNTTAFSTTGAGTLSIGGGLNAGVVATGGTTTNVTLTNTNLSVTGAVNIGSTSAAAPVIANVSMTGGAATFTLGANAFNVGLKSSTTATGTTGSFATLDLSGASSVSITGTAGSSIVLGSNTDGTASNNNSDVAQGTLKLSTLGTNTVAATTVTLGTSPSSGVAGIQGFLVLGEAANTFQVDTLYVGRQKSQTGAAPAAPADLLSFGGNTGGTFTLGGLAGSKTMLNIGYNDASGTGTTSVGTMDLTGGTFNGTLGTVSIGLYVGTGVGGGIGTLTIAAGATTADAIILATAAGSTVAANNAGTLNLNGGMLTLSGTGTGITNGGGTTVTGAATLTLNGGTLEMSNTKIGAASPNTVIFNAQSGTLSDVSQINNGGALNKTTVGVLTIAGVNTYTGSTTVSAGKLSVTGSVTATSGVSVLGGATLSGIGNGTTTGVIGSTSLASGGTVSVTGGNSTATQGVIDLRDATIGKLTIAGNNLGASAVTLTLGGTATNPSVLDFDLSSSTTDQLAVLQKVQVNAGGAIINLNQLASTTLAPGTYPLITFASDTGGAGYAPGAGFTGGPFNFSLLHTATAEDLVVTTSAVTPLYWKGDQSGAWNSFAPSNGASNWYKDAAATMQSFSSPSSTTDVFISVNTGAGNVVQTLGTDTTIRSLTFTGTGTTAGASSFTINGPNTLTLGNAAGITIQSGSAAQTINANVTASVSQTWMNNSANLFTVGGTVTKNGVTLTLDGGGAGGAFLISGSIVGAMPSSDLIIANTAVATLNSNGNTYNGPTSVVGGSTLKNGVTNALPVSTVLTLGSAADNSVGTYDLAGFNQTVAGLTTAGNGTPNTVADSAAGAGTNTLTVNDDSGNAAPANVNFTYSGVITDGATAHTALTKNGSLVFTLTGTNSYSGATTINAGTLQISAAANIGDSTKVTNTISLGAATLESTANTYNLGSNRVITLTGNGTIQSDAGTLTVDGNVTNGANLLTVTGAGNTTISGVIGNGAGGVTKNGVGTLVLSNASNSYTGGTSITGGILSVSADGDLGAAPVGTSNGVTIGAGTLQSTGASVTSARQVTVTDAASTIDVVSGATANVLTLSTGLNGSGTASLNLVSSGATATTIPGTLILTQAATGGYSGGATIGVPSPVSPPPIPAGPILSVAADSYLGATSGAVNLLNGTLQATGSITTVRQINFNDANSTIDVASNNGPVGNVVTLNTGIGGTGNLNLISSGAGTVKGTLVLTQPAVGFSSATQAVNVNTQGLMVTNTTGSATGMAAVNVGSATTTGLLGGGVNGAIVSTGAIAGNVTVHGGSFIAASNGAAGSNVPPTTLNLTGTTTTLATGSNYNWSLQNVTGAAGTDWDLLSISNLAVGSPNDVTVIPVVSSSSPGGTLVTGQIWDIATGFVANSGNTSPISNLAGQFQLTTNATALSAFATSIGAVGDPSSDFSIVVDGGDVAIQYTATPEPTSMMMLGLGAGGLMLRRRRRRTVTSETV